MGSEFSAPCAVGRKTLGQFTAPGGILLSLAYRGAAVRSGFRRELLLRVIYGEFFRAREISRERGFTEITIPYARGQYGATLQTGFCHRLVLRCGRFHSGEEGTSQD